MSSDDVRVLFLTRYGPLGASSRVRLLQFLPLLEAAGIRATVSPLLPDDYLRRLYAGGGVDRKRVAAWYAGRMRMLAGARRFDVVWIEKELFPWLPAWAESILSTLGVPYVVDYDDAIFHQYELHRSALVRRGLGRKIDAVMRHAALVTAGNEYLAERARGAGAARVEVLPSVVDTTRYALEAGPRGSAPFTIGWIGSPSTAEYLRAVAPALAEVCADGGCRFVTVGAGLSGLDGVPLEARSWAEDREVADIQEFDVGIMPLPDGPWELGKCGFKLIQYMACGVPVVASPVGANRTIVRVGETGYLANSLPEWVASLRTLRDDPARAREMGLRGRGDAEGIYSIAAVGPRLAELLRQLAGRS